MNLVLALAARLRSLLDAARPVAPLLTRLCVGGLFIVTGWGKVTHLSHTIEYFESLHIPMANIQAPMAAVTELGCGVLLLVGLFSRLAAAPLSVIMVVALVTAKKDDIDGFNALMMQAEFVIILTLAWIAVYGAGPLSLDHLLLKRFGGATSATKAGDGAHLRSAA